MAVFKKNGFWWIDYYFEGERRRDRIAPNKRLAETVLGKRLVEIAEGRFLDVKKRPKITFKEMADIFLEWSIANKEPGSWRNDIESLKKLKAHFKNRRLDQISPYCLETYKMNRSKQMVRSKKVPSGQKEIAKRTVDIELTCLKQLFSKAVKWKYLSSNPAAELELFRKDKRRTRYLSEDEISRFIAACDDYFRPVAIVAIHTGMRKGEILSLQWKHVHLKNGLISVEHTKNGIPRDVPMNETVKRELTALHEKKTCEWVFVRSRGHAQRLRDVRRPFEKAMRKAGIKDATFHTLRHTAGSLLGQRNIDIFTIADILGHKDTRQTAKYCHTSEEHRRSAVRVLDTIGHQLDTERVFGKVVTLEKPSK